MPKFVEFHLTDKRILGTPKTRLYHDFENKAGKPDFITSWSLEIWLSPKKKTAILSALKHALFSDWIPMKISKLVCRRKNQSSGPKYLLFLKV